MGACKDRIGEKKEKVKKLSGSGCDIERRQDMAAINAIAKEWADEITWVIICKIKEMSNEKE